MMNNDCHRSQSKWAARAPKCWNLLKWQVRSLKYCRHHTKETCQLENVPATMQLRPWNAATTGERKTATTWKVPALKPLTKQHVQISVQIKPWKCCKAVTYQSWKVADPKFYNTPQMRGSSWCKYYAKWNAKSPGANITIEKRKSK